MDGWRDGLNRLWWDGVTILPRPAKIIVTAKKQPSRPGPQKKKKHRPVPSRPVEKKKKSHPVPPRKKKPTAPSRLGKKNQPPRPASKKKQTAPSRHEQQNTPPRGWKLEINTTHRLSLFLSFLLHIYIVYWLSLTIRVLLAMYWHFRGGRYYYYYYFLFWLVSTLFSCQNCVSLRCCSCRLK